MLCVLIVEGMSVVVNVMFFPDKCDEPTFCLVQPIVANRCEVMYFGCFTTNICMADLDLRY